MGTDDLPPDQPLTAAELAAELGVHPDDVRGWAAALIPVRGMCCVYHDTLSRVLLTPWAVRTIRTEGFLTL
jgi:hypothetical protein